tara:strand:+ start:554 stop:823 length:270 start_codon:yes stop_codon:yes gene_type:complete
MSIETALSTIRRIGSLRELAKRGIDTSGEIKECEGLLDLCVKRLKALPDIEHYRKRKRWKGSFTDKQKDVIRKHVKTLSDASVAEELYS